jgi:DNA-binding transcriptional MerR regulator
MRTKEIIEKTGIDRETLRFYESKGLLPKTSRTNAGYRVYPESTIARLEFILNAKRAGFTLNEINELIDLQKINGACRIGRDIAVQKQLEIKNRIKALKFMNKVLESFVRECEKNGEKGLEKVCHFSFENCCK